MGARRRTAGIAGMLVLAAAAACAGGETPGSRAVVAGAPVTTAASAPPPTPAPAPPTTLEREPVVTEPEPAPAPVFLPAGVHEHQRDVDGVRRRWTTVVPAGEARTGLVVVLHGVGGRGLDMRSVGFEPLAAARGVVVAYPDAQGGAWNDGRPGADQVVPGAPVDDGRFLRLVIDETLARTGADGARVAIVGFSSGAVMASRVACDLAERIAAIALVAGTAGQGFEQSCRPARPMAVLMVAGASDPIVPYAGGRIANWGTRRRGQVAGVEELFAFWRAQNGCRSSHSVGTEARGTECRSGYAVVRHRVTGGVHEWYRAPRFDTTNVVWEFLMRRFSSVP